MVLEWGTGRGSIEYSRIPAWFYLLWGVGFVFGLFVGVWGGELDIFGGSAQALVRE